MYLNDLQTRVYFMRERSLDRSLEKRRLAHERRASTTTTTAFRHWRLVARHRRS